MCGSIGCDKDIDVFYPQYYIYVNKCSTDITISSFGPDYESKGFKIEHTFSIPIDGKETLTTRGDGKEGSEGLALSWDDSMSTMDYATFSNGVKIVTQKVDEGDGVPADNLYRNSNYTKIAERTFLYVFTDDFFADGVPIESGK
jgi:hypothetical protein